VISNENSRSVGYFIGLADYLNIKYMNNYQLDDKDYIIVR